MANVVARTKMSAAFIAAMRESCAAGGNHGKLGRRILTNEAAGVGVKFVQRDAVKQRPAVSADTQQQATISN
jgi:hypothetical protein